MNYLTKVVKFCLLAFFALSFLPRIHCDEQPPYDVKDPAIVENFRNIYLSVDKLSLTNTLFSYTLDSSTNRFCIDSPTLCVDAINHRVGIGTTGPATLLHLSSGTLTIDGTSPAIAVAGSTFVVTAGRIGIGTSAPATLLHLSSGTLAVDGTAGRVGIGTAGPLGPLHLAATSNQLVLGAVTATTTISATAPAAPLTYTIPDAGANASFVMTQGIQTIGESLFLSKSVNGTGPKFTTTNSNSTAGQNRFAGFTASGDNGSTDFTISSGKDTTNTQMAILQATGQIIFQPASVTALTLSTAQAATFAGAVTTTGVLTANAASGNPIHGTNTNNSASTGYVGEEIESSVTGVTTSSTAYTALTSISLTAGDWDLTGVCNLNGAGGVTQIAIAVGATSGSTAGCTSGYDQNTAATFSANGTGSVYVPRKRVSLSGTASYYLNCRLTAVVTTVDGSITARRMR